VSGGYGSTALLVRALGIIGINHMITGLVDPCSERPCLIPGLMETIKSGRSTTVVPLLAKRALGAIIARRPPIPPTRRPDKAPATVATANRRTTRSIWAADGRMLRTSFAGIAVTTFHRARCTEMVNEPFTLIGIVLVQMAQDVRQVPGEFNSDAGKSGSSNIACQPDGSLWTSATSNGLEITVYSVLGLR